MIKSRSAKAAAFAVLIAGLFIAPLLHEEPDAAVPEPVVVAAEPRFEIRRLPGHLHLAGHTHSEKHETDLLSVVATSFPGAEISHAFEPLGVVPDHWNDTTLQVLYVLEKTQSASAVLGTDTLRLRSVATDDIAWNNRLRALLDVLPSSIHVDNDALLVNPGIDRDSICDRAFASFDAGPINFEESTATFRSSAYPRLDRIAELAGFCSESSISVTGHTDGSGSESWNLRLSLKRSDAVRDYLIRRGVEPDRLTAAGAGSAVPVASNDTRYGRSKNRRIEIEWQRRQ